MSSVQSPVLSVPVATVERKKLPFNRKKPLAEPDSGRVAIRLDQLGFEKTEKRGNKNTIRRISVGTGKHELITTITIHNLYVLAIFKYLIFNSHAIELSTL